MRNSRKLVVWIGYQAAINVSCNDHIFNTKAARPQGHRTYSMKRIVLPFLFGGVLILAVIGVFISPWWHGFISPTKNAKCMPIDYPESPFDDPVYRSTPEPYVTKVLRSETSLKVIKDYYEANLIHQSSWDGDQEGYWRRSEVRPGEYLYQCGGRLNWEEVERGCIYLRERDGKTVVERIWLYSASAAPSCAVYLSELPNP